MFWKHKHHGFIQLYLCLDIHIFLWKGIIWYFDYGEIWN